MRGVMLEVPTDLLIERARTGHEGAAALVIEIRSPGDETLDKLPFYERVGVKEILVVDRDTKVLRHWARRGDRLVEMSPVPDGRIALEAIALSLRPVEAQLEVTTAAGVTLF